MSVTGARAGRAGRQSFPDWTSVCNSRATGGIVKPSATGQCSLHESRASRYWASTIMTESLISAVSSASVVPVGIMLPRGWSEPVVLPSSAVMSLLLIA